MSMHQLTYSFINSCYVLCYQRSDYVYWRVESRWPRASSPMLLYRTTCLGRRSDVREIMLVQTSAGGDCRWWWSRVGCGSCTTWARHLCLSLVLLMPVLFEVYSLLFGYLFTR